MIRTVKIISVLLMSGMLFSCTPDAKTKVPLINNQVTFLYYSDLNMAAHFYENVLQFRKTYDDGWVKIYQTKSGAAVGLVDMLRTGYDRHAEKQVMLSFEVSNIKAWYAYINGTDVKVLKPLAVQDDAGIEAFLIEDPGGYHVEFFKWK